MSETTAKLELPVIAAAQAQKHVTHNEALHRLDALVQCVVVSDSLVSPPASPAEGDLYIPASGATGVWAGHALALAQWSAGAWIFTMPKEGWRAYILSGGKFAVFDDGAWQPLASAGPIDKLGINATADLTNRLAVGSEASLFTHGGQNHRMTLNRNGAPDTASVLFARNYSASIEMGCAGSDDFSIRTKTGPSTWATAVTVQAATGNIGCGISTPTIAAAGRVHHIHAGASSGDWALSHYTTGTNSGAAQGVIAGSVGGTACLWNYDAAPLYLGTSSLARLVINAGGDVGIGLLSPSTRLHVDGPVRCGSFTVSTVPSAVSSGAGAQIFVSNESGGAVMAFSDGTNWRRVTDRAVIS